MRKNKLLILLSVLIFAVIGAAFSFAALSATAKLTGPDKIYENDTFALEFKVNCDTIYGMEAKLDITGPIEQESITLNPALTGWTVESMNGVFMVYSNDLATPVSGENVTLFTMKYKLTDEAKIGDTLSVKFTDVVLANHLTSDQTDPFAVTYSKTIQKRPSTNTNLTSLKINGSAVDGFDHTITEYALKVPYETDSVSVSATCAGEGASYSVTGNSGLKVGVNNVVVRVTAASGDTKNYTVKVTRDNPPNLARLTNLTAESYTLSPAFDSNVFAYTVSVPYTKKSITIKPSADDGITYAVTGGSDLSVGDNIVTVKVTDQYENTAEYTVTVTRRQNNNTNLLKLVIEGYELTPLFHYTITNYNLTVPASVTSLEIDAVAAGDGASFDITGNEFDSAGGKVIITVTAMDGTTKNYTINVKKEGAPVDPVDPPAPGAAKLNSLILKNATLSPAFSSSVTSYTATVPGNVTVLDLEAFGENGSEVIIKGATNLKVGQNRVSIIVKAEGKTDSQYEIIVTRSEEEPTPDSPVLDSITLSTGTLSPAFDPKVFTYIVYLPHETAKLTLSATAESGAQITGTGDYTLLPGSNPLTLQVIVGDKNTTYSVIAYVMPAFSGTVPGINETIDPPTPETKPIFLSIIGNGQVGTSLNAVVDGMDTYLVHWFRDDSAVGANANYIVTAEDAGKTLTVIVYDESGNALMTREINIPKNTPSTSNKKDSGFDWVGMIISLVAALATLIIGFILGKMYFTKKA
ncbi:MAG: hypothetical protein E7616_07395 [Ruminococcaceae bacterium]|nr:hypothetical protein [Oscillospiraceae bacterium]